MLSNDLKKLFQLTKKSGDKLVVYDSVAPENSFVMLDINSYEKLVDSSFEQGEEPKNIDKQKQLNRSEEIEDNIEKKKKEKKENEKVEKNPKNEDNQDLTEENLTDRINREISMWKSGNEMDFLSEEDKNKKPWNIPSSVKKKAKEIE
ncbi:MAG: hypothetical protein PF488_02825 [Patescibacteria group bacterium]|jgi:hypothetical protein|nr:hypothetical protein [Patescibacteria group bacterium]